TSTALPAGGSRRTGPRRSARPPCGLLGRRLPPYRKRFGRPGPSARGGRALSARPRAAVRPGRPGGTSRPPLPPRTGSAFPRVDHLPSSVVNGERPATSGVLLRLDVGRDPVEAPQGGRDGHQEDGGHVPGELLQQEGSGKGGCGHQAGERPDLGVVVVPGDLLLHEGTPFLTCADAAKASAARRL